MKEGWRTSPNEVEDASIKYRCKEWVVVDRERVQEQPKKSMPFISVPASLDSPRETRVNGALEVSLEGESGIDVINHQFPWGRDVSRRRIATARGNAVRSRGDRLNNEPVRLEKEASP